MPSATNHVMAHEMARRRREEQAVAAKDNGDANNEPAALVIDASEKVKETSRTAVRTARCLPFRFGCCLCMSLHGVLQLMRSETTPANSHWPSWCR